MTFTRTEQRMHTALLVAAELIEITARVGCAPIIRKSHQPSFNALAKLTDELAALGYIDLPGIVRGS